MNKLINKLKDKLPKFCNTQDFWYVKFKDKQHYIDKKKFVKRLVYKLLTFVSIAFIFVFAIMVDNLCIRTIGLIISVDVFGIVAFNEGKYESE
nr:MAG TPA: hypothetical protein [Caudoviricetes sp.]